MADFLKFLLLLLPACAALADDPTRPPPGFVEKPAAATGEEAQEAPPPRIDAIFSVGGKSYAMVDGQAVRVGDELGGGRITRIDEQGVWLKTPQGPQQLKLLPDVKKTAPGGKEKP